MTIGKKFLERVLGSSQVEEAVRAGYEVTHRDPDGGEDKSYMHRPQDQAGRDRLAKKVRDARKSGDWDKERVGAANAKRAPNWFVGNTKADAGKGKVSEDLHEAKGKDVDGFKDDFDITTLSPASPAVANLPMPMARQVVQLYHLMGVSAETLEMRPKAVKEAAMEVADEMRTNRSLRMAAQRLFSALATAKGFARKEEEVMEATASMSPETDLQLVGSTIVKQMEAVLAALKLPAGVLQRAMRRDQAAMMETADLLRTGAARAKFAMLASELGVDLMDIGQKVKVDEAFETQTTFVPGKNFKQYWSKLRDENAFEWDIEGDDDHPDHAVLTVLNSNKAAIKKAQEYVARGVLRMTGGVAGRDTNSGYAASIAKARKESLTAQIDDLLALFEDGAVEPQETTVQKNSGAEAFHAAASELIAQLGLDVAALPNAKMLDRKMMLAQRGDAFNSRAIRMMKGLTGLLKSNNR